MTQVAEERLENIEDIGRRFNLPVLRGLCKLASPAKLQSCGYGDSPGLADSIKGSEFGNI